MPGYRLHELNTISCSTLVVNGTKDPLINIEHAKKYINLLPQTKKLFVEGINHDLPSKFLDHAIKTRLDHLFSNKQ